MESFQMRLPGIAKVGNDPHSEQLEASLEEEDNGEDSIEVVKAVHQEGLRLKPDREIKSNQFFNNKKDHCLPHQTSSRVITKEERRIRASTTVSKYLSSINLQQICLCCCCWCCCLCHCCFCCCCYFSAKFGDKRLPGYLETVFVPKLPKRRLRVADTARAGPDNDFNFQNLDNFLEIRYLDRMMMKIIVMIDDTHIKYWWW